MHKCSLFSSVFLYNMVNGFSFIPLPRCACTYTNTTPDSHACTHTNNCTCTHTYACTYTHTHKQIHMHTRMHTHTYIHTNMCASMLAHISFSPISHTQVNFISCEVLVCSVKRSPSVSLCTLLWQNSSFVQVKYYRNATN